MNNNNSEKDYRKSLNKDEIYVVERTPDMGIDELIESIREKIKQVLPEETNNHQITNTNN